MKSADRPGLSTALLAFGGAGVAFFPLAAGIGLGDPMYFAIVSLAVLAPLLQHYRGQGLRRTDVMLLGFLVLQFVGGMIQALTDGDGQFSLAISPADVAFVLSYLLAAAGLGLRVAEIKGRALTIGGIDAAILITGLLLMGGQFLLYPTLHPAGADGTQQAIPSLLRVWYPICAYLLLALMVWVTAACRQGTPALLMLEAGFTTWALAESAFHLTSRSLSVPPWWIQALWLTSYVLIGAGIADPDKGRLPPGESPGADELPSRAGFLAIALLSIPVSMWAQRLYQDPTLHLLVMMACTVLALLIWLRFNLLYRHLRSLGGVLRELSETDPVSGAWNRRHFNEVLQEALKASSPPSLFMMRIEGSLADAPRSTQERCLRAAVGALGRVASADEPVARIGEREFALILRRPMEDEKLLGSAWRVLNEFNDLLLTELPDDAERHARGFIGIAVALRDGATVGSLIDAASKRVDAAFRSGYRVVAADPEDLAAAGPVDSLGVVS
jgi:GGDEF domain-containing protein